MTTTTPTTTTCPCDYNDNDCTSSKNCIVAQSTLSPDCFKLRLGFDPTNGSYDLSICSFTVVFTDQCCINGANGVILRIPLTFGQDCYLYRVNATTTTIIATVFTVTGGTETTTTDNVTPYFLNGFMYLPISRNDIAFTQNSSGQCVATIVFASFSIPLLRISSYCDCPQFCTSVEWILNVSQATVVSAP